jgi:hypothetical protein
MLADINKIINNNFANQVINNVSKIDKTTPITLRAHNVSPGAATLAPLAYNVSRPNKKQYN